MLNVRSAPDQADLTMRARIRDAAVELFGQKGFDRATVREIADRAGASAPLVLHHFGSKAGLRDVCDEYVVSSLLAERGAALRATGVERVEGILAGVGMYRARLDYLARLMIEPGDAGARVFDALLEHTRQLIREAETGGPLHSMSDPDVTALLLTAYGLAPLVLQAHLTRGLGVDSLSPAGARILAIPGLELFTRGLYRDDRLLSAAKEALSRQTGPRSDKGDNDPNQDPDPPVADTPSDPST